MDPLLERGTPNSARLLVHRFAAVKHHKIGDPRHAKARRKRRLFIGVHLENQGLSREFSRHGFELRLNRSTRTAPRGPEVHEDWNLCFPNDCVKIPLGSGKGSAGGWKLIFAGPTVATVGKVLIPQTPQFVLLIYRREWLLVFKMNDHNFRIKKPH